MAASPQSDADLRESLARFTDQDLALLRCSLLWKSVARKKQIPPPCPPGEWDFYGVKSGRGFGKTLAAVQWLWQQAARDPGSYNFVVAPTHEDLIKVCFFGPTGLHGNFFDKRTNKVYPIIPPHLIKWSTKSPLVICLWNDALIQGFSADTPERLRGPQCHRAWCDEVASWRYPEKTWDNLIMGLRLGEHPQIFWTGTPKPKPFIRTLVKLPRSIIINGSTYENRENLPRTFFENVAKYEGTSVGRQELYGEILDPEEAGFVKRSQWRLWPATKKLPKFRLIVMSLDTAFTEKQWDKKEQTGDPTACSVWGIFTYERQDHIMLLDAWEDYLGFPALIKRVKVERTYTYGDQDEPVLRPLIEKVQRPKHTGRPVDLILLEDKGSGISLRQQLAVEDILTESYNPEGMDKLSRLHACSPLFPHGRIWAVESLKAKGEPRNWADPLISQVCTYVGEGSLVHDDLLDSATQAWIWLMHRFSIKFTVKDDPNELTKRNLEKIRPRRNPYDARGIH